MPMAAVSLASPHVVFCTQNPGNKLAFKRAECSGAGVL